MLAHDQRGLLRLEPEAGQPLEAQPAGAGGLGAIAEGLLQKDELEEDEIKELVEAVERREAELKRTAAARPIPLPVYHRDDEALAAGPRESEAPTLLREPEAAMEEPEDEVEPEPRERHNGIQGSNGHSPTERAAFRRHNPFE